MIEIKLTQGQVAVIDDEDADLARVKWSAAFNPDCANGGAYRAVRTVITSRKPLVKKSEQLSRIVMTRALMRPLTGSEFVIHISHNKLDCCRDNLRLATWTEVTRHKRMSKNNTSDYKGVCLHESGLWYARITADKKSHFLGFFETRIEAARAYDAAALKLHGAFAALNIDLVQEEVL